MAKRVQTAVDTARALEGKFKVQFFVTGRNGEDVYMMKEIISGLGLAGVEYTRKFVTKAQEPVHGVEVKHAARFSMENFTKTLPHIKAQGIKTCYLVTSYYHMPRCMAALEQFKPFLDGPDGINIEPVMTKEPAKDLINELKMAVATLEKKYACSNGRSCSCKNCCTRKKELAKLQKTSVEDVWLFQEAKDLDGKTVMIWKEIIRSKLSILRDTKNARCIVALAESLRTKKNERENLRVLEASLCANGDCGCTQGKSKTGCSSWQGPLKFWGGHICEQAVAEDRYIQPCGRVWDDADHVCAGCAAFTYARLNLNFRMPAREFKDWIVQENGECSKTPKACKKKGEKDNTYFNDNGVCSLCGETWRNKLNLRNVLLKQADIIQIVGEFSGRFYATNDEEAPTNANVTAKKDLFEAMGTKDN